MELSASAPVDTTTPSARGLTRDARMCHPRKEAHMGRGLLLWLIGIPLPIILLIWAFGGLS
jgi:hypothetical protein